MERPYRSFHTDARIDDPELYDGSYVGLQVVGRRLQEERTLALAEVVDNALKSAK